MGLNLKDYCCCNFPLEESGAKTVSFNHEGINIFAVGEKHCTVKLKNKSITAEKGEIVYATEEIELEVEEGGHIWGININGSLANRFCRENQGVFVIGSVFAPYLPRQITQIASNYTLMSEQYLTNSAFEIINTLINCDKKSVLASKLVSQAIILIEQNYTKDYGVEELANQLNVSKSHLVREFYKYTGITPGKYISNVRIEAVKNLLAQSSLSLGEIAFKTGFSGDNYLCKSFKKHTGQTPMEYRTKIIKSQYLPNQLSLKIDPEIYY